MYATMSTSLVVASCTIAGMRPCSSNLRAVGSAVMRPTSVNVSYVIPKDLVRARRGKWPHRDAAFSEKGLDLADAQGSVVEDRRREQRIRLSLSRTCVEMLERPGAPRRDHRDGHRSGHGRGERQIVSGELTVGVHAGQQDLSRSPLDSLSSPQNGVDPGRPPA